MQKSETEILKVILPWSKKTDWRDVLPGILNKLKALEVQLDCCDWKLSCRDIKQLEALFAKEDKKINCIYSNIPETIVSATALGHLAYLKPKNNQGAFNQSRDSDPKLNKSNKLLFHKGTLRSGDHLQAFSDVLLLGDVNPGAQISAGGDVMVWGRLLGTAHAGREGDTSAKIIALQLRPLQLRIANAIARGPDEKPQAGLAEEARIQDGQILIAPVRMNPLTH